uniref:NB-ARC domain containing protein n=1 Tax=Solanum tuberosum TaxID=4113 RepID=M1DUA5_SOLTU
MTSSGQKCVTNESRWANMVEEEEEHVTPHSKLSPGAPAFVPKGSSIAYVSSPLHRGRQLILAGSNVQKVYVSDNELIDALGVGGGVVSDKELIDALGGSDVERLVSLTPINTNKQLQVGGSSTFSPNQFANLQDEESDEDDWLDQYFENVARDANISPRQQCNIYNKKKHVRKNSWNDKVHEEVVPKHLSMRLAKQNHMTVSTYSTRSNNSKKK